MEAFGRYKPTRQLGRGAMGDVYLAVDEVLGREVAIKTLRPQYFGLMQLDERFRNEARAIAKLSHPGIVQLYDLDLAAEPPFLVLERVAGPSLAERIESGPLPIEEVVALGVQVARALAAAHAAGIVHRDVKPENILGAGIGAWKLADFGVAHVPDSSLTMTGQFIGSPAYAPPEALAAGASGERADVYGLGATLYEAATGKWPRVAGEKALFEPVPPLREVAPSVPAWIASAIDLAIITDVSKRPTALELADLLARGPRDVPKKKKLRWPLAVGVLAGCLAIAVIASQSGKTAPSSASQATTKPEAPSAPVATDRHDDDQDDRDDDHRIKDFDHIRKDIEKRHVKEALHHLDDYEDRYGENDETRALRDEIRKLPPDPGPPGKKKHH